ncbi:adhesin [Streptomyces spinoverrucosus]|uniref:Adhesin n=1 Tax=Streptomyces spinoverrucosus TaxID=284043 RepID=A0A4Y3VNH3_9ACTN|nr:ScbA/BarX family gamma-butyrolactone biosynthesis protein [Streptomyces spinoverrucosus]GEC07311.1 adhesin [Streptomyces spinoverrucosus]GHB55470.1 adhesin [Streptomyces spinoverrucosus]
MSPLVQADRLEFLTLDNGEVDLFERTVPRWLVHRAAVSEVLITGVRPHRRDVYRVGAQWARGHSYYGPVAGRWHDPMLLGESIRQAGLLLAHQALGIPQGQRFLTKSTSFEITEEGARLGGAPANVVLEVTLKDIRCRREHVVSFACDVLAHRDGTLIGHGYAATDCVAPAVYRRLRGERAEVRPACTLVPAVQPELVGRTREFDVVLGVPGGEAGNDRGVHLLRVDATHPVLFDHPVDHVPGMLVMEAARQAALARLGLPHGLLVGCDAAFHRYVELDLPCVVSASEPTVGELGRRSLTVEFHQGGSVVGRCTVTVLDTEVPDA